MKKIIEDIKNANLTTLFIIFGAFVGIVCIFAIISFFIKRRGNEVTYSKADFVHKMLAKDNTIKHQIATALSVGLLVAFGVLFFMSVNLPALIVLGVLGIAWLCKIYLRLDEYFDRVEYNPKSIYRFGFLRKTVEIEWKDVQNVTARGAHNHRSLVFYGKKKSVRIVVDLGREGSYDFLVFCEKTLEGKNFEAIRIVKGRR